VLLNAGVAVFGECGGPLGPFSAPKAAAFAQKHRNQGLSAALWLGEFSFTSYILYYTEYRKCVKPCDKKNRQGSFCTALPVFEISCIFAFLSADAAMMAFLFCRCFDSLNGHCAVPP